MSDRPLVTLVSTACGAPDAMALMIESFREYHGSVPFAACDNSGGSDDRLREYLLGQADEVLLGGMASAMPVPHGVALDNLCKSVRTPYTLIVDSDVEFREPVLPDMLAILGAGPSVLACCLPDRPPAEPWTVDIYGDTLHVQPRINPALALFDTHRIQNILENFSWCDYLSVQTREYFDAGGMLYRVAKAAGWLIAAPEWLYDRVVHYGGISLLDRPDASEEQREVAVGRYLVIQNRLAYIRQGEIPISE